MPLTYPPFQASKALRSVLEGKAALRKGAKGTAVRLIQAGLIQAGHPLPASAAKGGIPDGDFGAETELAVKAFQTRVSLEPDGAVGKKTLAALDAVLRAPPPPAGPKPIPIASTREYKVGIDPPRYSNWFFAIGGYRVYGSGTVGISFARGQRHYDLDFHYHMRDRYNWDGGKEVSIPSVFSDEPIVITDEFMGEFHRQGLAREFYCVGSVRRRLRWSQGLPISQKDLYTPGGRT